MAVAAGEFDLAIAASGRDAPGSSTFPAGPGRFVALIMPMHDDIVEVESPETGTPLPDSYQAAPPLI